MYSSNGRFLRKKISENRKKKIWKNFHELLFLLFSNFFSKIISSEATRFERSENRVSFFPSEARKKASRNSYIKWPSGVFPKYEIVVISRAKSAVHKDIKVKNDEVRAKREPSLLQ